MKWRRGFSRLGILLGAVGALSAAFVGYLIVNENISRLNRDYDRFACLLSENNNLYLAGLAFKSAATNTKKCGYFSTYDNYESLGWWANPGTTISYNGRYIPRMSEGEISYEVFKQAVVVVLATIATFVVIWGAFYCIGWVFAGFSREAS